MTTTEADTKALKEFSDCPRPLRRILVISTILILILACMAWQSIWPFPAMRICWPTEDGLAWARLTFLAYLCAYGSVWIVYFGSLIDHRYCRVQSLRMLLYLTVWKATLHETASSDPKKRTTFIQEKADASMTTLAMLVAAATLELGQFNLNWRGTELGGDLWLSLVLGGGTLVAFAALVMFLIAGDLLDSLFNRYQDDAERHTLVKFFYGRNINPRYVGVVLLVLGEILVIAFHSPVAASSALGFVLAIGYAHWFPRISVLKPSRLRVVSGILARIFVVALPLFVVFI
jgi:hypothetical protein